MTFQRDPVGRWAAMDRPLRRLPRWGALAVLAALFGALAWVSITTADFAGEGTVQAVAAGGDTSAIGDFELYARIVERVSGENYYAAAMELQRENNYPTRPFVTVRLPTLAWLNAWLGSDTIRVLVVALLLANLVVWHRQLSRVATAPERVFGLVLLFISGIGAFEARAGLIHELIAGLLLSLALGLYRPERWWPSLLLAALALAVRELAAPFVLLWLFLAASERRWKEAAAVAVLLAVFGLGLYLHYLGVEAHRLPGDRPSPGWDAMLGPQMALYSLSRLTALLYLPPPIAGPIALLPLLGWIGVGGRLSLFASLWFVGFFLSVALFARAENFYWVLMVLPAYAAGLALAPRTLADLVRALKAPIQN